MKTEEATGAEKTTSEKVVFRCENWDFGVTLFREVLKHDMDMSEVCRRSIEKGFREGFAEVLKEKLARDRRAEEFRQLRILKNSASKEHSSWMCLVAKKHKD